MKYPVRFYLQWEGGSAIDARYVGTVANTDCVTVSKAALKANKGRVEEYPPSGNRAYGEVIGFVPAPNRVGH